MDSREKSDVVEPRKPFEEPSVSAPLELGEAAKAGPLMAMIAASTGGALDGGFGNDNTGLDPTQDGSPYSGGGSDADPFMGD